jgi:hypothetical protein
MSRFLPPDLIIPDVEVNPIPGLLDKLVAEMEEATEGRVELKLDYYSHKDSPGVGLRISRPASVGKIAQLIWSPGYIFPVRMAGVVDDKWWYADNMADLEDMLRRLFAAPMMKANIREAYRLASAEVIV